jgi:hypothetical protein
MVCAIWIEGYLLSVWRNTVFKLIFEEMINRQLSFESCYWSRASIKESILFCTLNCFPQKKNCKISFSYLWNKDILVPFFSECSNHSIKKAKVQINFLTNSDNGQNCWALLEVLKEALSMNKMVQTVDLHYIDFLSVNHVEIRCYILHDFSFSSSKLHNSGNLDTCKSSPC